MVKKPLEIEFERLIKDHELLIFKVCRIYAYTNQDRQDLLQEIMIQLWKSYQSFKGLSKFSTWLYKVAIHTAIASIRKQKNFIYSTDPENLPYTVPQVEYDTKKDEQLAGLYKAIEQLNEFEKAIVMLYLEAKSYEEMEAILGINQGNLRVKMNRIKEKLRQIIKN